MTFTLFVTALGFKVCCIYCNHNAMLHFCYNNNQIITLIEGDGIIYSHYTTVFCTSSLGEQSSIIHKEPSNSGEQSNKSSSIFP